MYSVSPEFLTAMDSPVQEHKVTGTIGSATFGPANILAGSFSINAKLCSEQEIQIGQVYIAELSATFRNVSVNQGEWQGKVITPTFSLKTENGWEDVPLGVFTVQEATISASGVTVKAYDNMAKFDKYCTTYRGAGGGAGVEGATSVVVGRTTYDMLQMICHKVGVVFGMTRMEVAALPNSGNGWDLFSDNDITTYRDMLSWMAQTLSCNATINREGKLVLVPFKSASDYTFDDEHRHEGASFKDFTTRITEIALDCKPMERTYSYHVSPNNGLSYELGQNPYLQIGTAEDRDDAMNDILTALQEVNYTPFDVNLTGCPIFDLGDVLTFTGGITGGLKKGAVTSFTYTYNAAYKLACGGKNPAEASAKSATDKRMDGINSSVTSQGKPVMVVRNAESVTLGDGSEVTVIDYPFEVTDSVNLTIVSTEIVMTTEATETEAGDVFTIGDIVARAILYLDGIEIGDLYPEFIVDEGTDTINFDYSLKDLTVGAHNYTVKLELNGGDGEINENDVHESLWGYGITFEVYLKAIQVTNPPTYTTFYTEDTLYFDGIEVAGIYNNGKTKDVTDNVTFDPPAGTSLADYDPGTYDIEVDYEEDGNVYSTTFPIEVAVIEDTAYRYQPLSESKKASGFTFFGIGMNASDGMKNFYAVNGNVRKSSEAVMPQQSYMLLGHIGEYDFLITYQGFSTTTLNSAFLFLHGELVGSNLTIEDASGNAGVAFHGNFGANYYTHLDFNDGCVIYPTDDSAGFRVDYSGSSYSSKLNSAWVTIRNNGLHIVFKSITRDSSIYTAVTNGNEVFFGGKKAGRITADFTAKTLSIVASGPSFSSNTVSICNTGSGIYAKSLSGAKHVWGWDGSEFVDLGVGGGEYSFVGMTDTSDGEYGQAVFGSYGSDWMTVAKYSDILAAPYTETITIPGSYDSGNSYAFSIDGLAIFCGWLHEDHNKFRYYAYDFGTGALRRFNVEVEEE